MSTIDHPEPNTTVARLHLSLNGGYASENLEDKKQEVIDELDALIEEDTRTPTGATILEGTGIWKPRTDDGTINRGKEEEENTLVIEMWLDSVEECNRVREIKNILETRFDQYCVCLSLEDRYYEH